MSTRFKHPDYNIHVRSDSPAFLKRSKSPDFTVKSVFKIQGNIFKNEFPRSPEKEFQALETDTQKKQ